MPESLSRNSIVIGMNIGCNDAFADKRQVDALGARIVAMTDSLAVLVSRVAAVEMQHDQVFAVLRAVALELGIEITQAASSESSGTVRSSCNSRQALVAVEKKDVIFSCPVSIASGTSNPHEDLRGNQIESQRQTVNRLLCSGPVKTRPTRYQPCGSGRSLRFRWTSFACR
jgi:hypothetical protein